MPSQDSYTVALDNIASCIEKTYCITDSGTTSNSIIDVITFLDKLIIEMKPEEVAKRNEDVGKQIVMLTYLSERLIYFEGIRLDFVLFPALEEIVKILKMFIDKRQFNKSVRQLNKIIKILAEVDNTSMKARYGLGYRYLRIFVTLVMYQSSCNASIVARFIGSQIIMKAMVK